MATYYQEIEAVQWDGSEEMLYALKKRYPEDPRMWITSGDLPESKNGLRINNLKHQGDYYVLVGDYLELTETRIWHHSKGRFEKIYKLRQ